MFGNIGEMIARMRQQLAERMAAQQQQPAAAPVAANPSLIGSKVGAYQQPLGLAAWARMLGRAAPTPTAPLTPGSAPVAPAPVMGGKMQIPGMPAQVAPIVKGPTMRTPVSPRFGWRR